MVKVPREFMRAALQHAVHELLDVAVTQVGARRPSTFCRLPSPSPLLCPITVASACNFVGMASRASGTHRSHPYPHVSTAAAAPPPCHVQGPPPPSQLAARVRCLQSCVAQLPPALGFDLNPDLFESLLLHCQPEPGTDAYPLDSLTGLGGCTL